MSELLLYFSHKPDSDFINSLLKSTYLEQIKHFIFLSLFLKMLLPFSWALLSTPMLLLVGGGGGRRQACHFFHLKPWRHQQQQHYPKISPLVQQGLGGGGEGERANAVGETKNHNMTGAEQIWRVWTNTHTRRNLIFFLQLKQSPLNFMDIFIQSLVDKTSLSIEV